MIQLKINNMDHKAILTVPADYERVIIALWTIGLERDPEKYTLDFFWQLGWIQNVVIMEAELTMDLREWYMKAAEQFGWSKTELIANIAANAHENIVLAIEEEVCYIVEQEEKQAESQMELPVIIKNVIHQEIRRIRKWWLIWKGGGRRWHTMLWVISMEKQAAFMRC